MMSLIYTQVCKSSMFIEGQLGRGNCIIFIGIDKDLNVYDSLDLKLILKGNY